jgi:hypothetical protein
MVNIKNTVAVALMAAAGGCATLTDSDRQVVALQTIQDHREIAGAGCVLSNRAGRWFVTSPGRVTIDRSPGPLAVDCASDGGGSGRELVASRFDTGKLIGNLVVTAGLGYLVDSRSGAGFAYPSTLTVILHQAPAQATPSPAAAPSQVY